MDAMIGKAQDVVEKPDTQHMSKPDPLFDILAHAVESKLQPERRVDLPRLCDKLGLPSAPDDQELTKRQYIQTRLDILHNMPEKTRPIALEFTKRYPVAKGNQDTFKIEELLWKDAKYPTITKRLRREIAQGLEQEYLYCDADGFLSALEQLWVLQDWLSGQNSLYSQIQQHVIDNPKDWSVEKFFQQLGALDCSNVRFGKLMETLASPEVRPDEQNQWSFVAAVNRVLHPHSLELAETGEKDGYPSFSLQQTGTGATGRPKNLIFASQVKPDLRFRDAVNNDIEIVTGADKVLIYDHPTPVEGLRWRDLQAWWAKSKGHVDEKNAKKTLYYRLLSSLPVNSPPQKLLFKTFFKHFGKEIPDLPALLPEVWLHYDPQTVKRRGRDALLRQRMDFLLLISRGTRIVLEVDGAHHYSDNNGKAAPARYADMVAADRELKLRGYDVYRFGGSELRGDDGQQLVKTFFDHLFKKHGFGKCIQFSLTSRANCRINTKLAQSDARLK